MGYNESDKAHLWNGQEIIFYKQLNLISKK